MLSTMKKYLKVTLSLRTHKPNKNGKTESWCYSDVSPIKGTFMGASTTDKESKDFSSISVLRGGKNIALSDSSLGIFIWKNNWDNEYAMTVKETYGEFAYVSIEWSDEGAIKSYEVIDSETFNALEDSIKNATVQVRLPDEQPQSTQPSTFAS